MDVSVDREVCETHAQCVRVASSVFWLDDEGELAFDPHPDEAVRASVEHAEDICPTRAIRILH